MPTISTQPPSRVYVRGSQGNVRVNAVPKTSVRVIQTTTPQGESITDLVVHYRLLAE